MLNEILKSCWPACVETDPKVPNQRYCYFTLSYFYFILFYIINIRKFKADVIISNPVTYGHVHCAEALGIPLHLMFPQVYITIMIPY